MDHILQRVVGSQRMSMLDGFSGCNPPKRPRKYIFTTPWGTFMYAKMPFGLMDAGATFQREMDIAFVEEKEKYVVIYLDHIIVFFKIDPDHLQHLRKVFCKCRKFGISLNPKKTHFAMEEGKLLGHIISEKGIKRDLDRVATIQQIGLPRNKKEIQSFLGKVNFLRRFITNFVEVVKYINSMLKKDTTFQWYKEAKQSFVSIKQALSEALVLVSPNFGNDFIIFSFASQHTIAGLLLKKNEQNEEKPIAFYNKA